MQLVYWQKLALERFGEDPDKWVFVCPECGHRQTPEDMLALGMHRHQVDNRAGYSCIRRWTDQGCLSVGQGPVPLVIDSDTNEIRPTFIFDK